MTSSKASGEKRISKTYLSWQHIEDLVEKLVEQIPTAV